jgi:hypothetical protein
LSFDFYRSGWPLTALSLLQDLGTEDQDFFAGVLKNARLCQSDFRIATLNASSAASHDCAESYMVNDLSALLRLYHHRRPDVSGVVKLTRFPIGHPDASM